MRAIFIAVLFALGSASIAQAANVNEGNWEVGGGWDLSRSSGRTSFTVRADGQYFFADQLSAGLDTSYYHSGAYDAYSLGPVVTKYVWADEKLFPYLSMLPIALNKSGSYTYASSRARVGVKYFFTDSVAFGPAAEYTHYWESDRMRSSDAFSFLGLFSIHLD